MLSSYQMSLWDFDTEDDSTNQESDFDKILKTGTGFTNGKERVKDFVATGAAVGEIAEFLKREYGIGGRSFSFNDGENGFVNYDAKGIFAARWKDEDKSKLYPWKQVAQRIKELIILNKY